MCAPHSTTSTCIARSSYHWSLRLSALVLVSPNNVKEGSTSVPQRLAKCLVFHKYVHISNLHSVPRKATGIGDVLKPLQFSSPLPHSSQPPLLFLYLFPTKLYGVAFNITHAMFLSKGHTLHLSVDSILASSQNELTSPFLLQRCLKGCPLIDAFSDSLI